jgi:hypothetical protein
MVNFFICFIMSIMASFGMSIILVNKSDTWPVRKYRILLQLLIRKIHYKAPRVFKCETCCSFWCILFVDSLIFLFINHYYFFWPLSGFAVAGLVWTTIELLNILDKE